MDFPEPSEPSTMMRVPGRSSVEKNISFWLDGSFMSSFGAVGVGVLVFGEVGVGIGEKFTEGIICKKPSVVNKIRVFLLALCVRYVVDTLFCTSVFLCSPCLYKKKVIPYAV